MVSRALIAILSPKGASIELDRRPSNTAPCCIDDWLALGDLRHTLLDALGLGSGPRHYWAVLVSKSDDHAVWHLHGHEIVLRIVDVPRYG